MARKNSPENGRSFRRLRLMIPSFNFGEKNDAMPILGTIEKAVTIIIDNEPRKALHFKLSEGATDGEGVVYDAGDLVLVWQNAALFGLENYEGDEVRITPNGFGKKEGKKSPPRLFDVDIVE